MIKQIFSISFLVLWLILTSYGFISPLLFINKEKIMVDTITDNFKMLSAFFIENGFNSNIKINGELKQTKNKIDIIICNHISTIDSFYLCSLLQKYKINNFYFVGKREIIYYPGFGIPFMFGNHIKLIRNWEEDKFTIQNQINNLKEGVILLFPEGTRFNEKKLIEGNIFSKENNLPIYNNLLVPKSKGFIAIYESLLKINKLGNIFDITIIMGDYVKKNIFMRDLINKNKLNTNIIIRKLNVNKEDTDLKKWLLTNWTNKDNIIDNYKKYSYNNFKNNYDYKHLILNLLIVLQFIYLLYDNKKYRVYFIGMIITTYLLIHIRRNKIKKLKK